MVENGYMEAVLGGGGADRTAGRGVHWAHILECGHLLKNTIER